MNVCHRFGPAWYVVQCAPRTEEKAGRNIRDLGLDVYCPVERVPKRMRGRKVTIERPLFPGYVFTSFDVYRDEWQAIEHVDGVLDLLCNNEWPSRVPTAWIDALRKSEAMGVFDQTQVGCTGYAVGETVRIGEGTFSGFHAVIKGFIAKVKSASPSKRAKVLVSFMNRMVALELPIETLEKA